MLAGKDGWPVKTGSMENPIHTWSFGQPWLSQPDPDFAPGQVMLGFSGNELLIRAELTDAHPMQDAFPFNFPAFTQCDAFEIFLGPADGKAYYELHVTPSNSVLQLFFDGSGVRKTIEHHAVAEPLFTSQTALTATGWSVEARIPLQGLFPGEHPEWQLSFGRYDHTPETGTRVVSNTSPHAVCDFHCKPEWRRVRLADLANSN
jgi:hypothetical protein